MKKKPILLLTGASGSIGSSLVSKLAFSDLYEIITLGKNHPANDVKLDLSFPDSHQVIRDINPDYVIHLVGTRKLKESFIDPVFDMKTNVLGTLNLMRGLSDRKEVTITFATSGAIYGPVCLKPFTENSPLSRESPYAISKVTAESYVTQQSLEFGHKWTSLAISNTYGPLKTHKTGVISSMLMAIKENSPLELIGQEVTRDFIHVDDVSDAFILSLNNPAGARLNISSMQERSLIEVFSNLKQITGSDLEPVWQEPELGATLRNCLDNSKARRLLGWSPKREFLPALRSIWLSSKA